MIAKTIALKNLAFVYQMSKFKDVLNTGAYSLTQRYFNPVDFYTSNFKSYHGILSMSNKEKHPEEDLPGVPGNKAAAKDGHHKTTNHKNNKKHNNDNEEDDDAHEDGRKHNQGNKDKHPGEDLPGVPGNKAAAKNANHKTTNHNNKKHNEDDDAHEDSKRHNKGNKDKHAGEDLPGVPGNKAAAKNGHNNSNTKKKDNTSSSSSSDDEDDHAHKDSRKHSKGNKDKHAGEDLPGVPGNKAAAKNGHHASNTKKKNNTSSSSSSDDEDDHAHKDGRKHSKGNKDKHAGEDLPGVPGNKAAAKNANHKTTDHNNKKHNSDNENDDAHEDSRKHSKGNKDKHAGEDLPGVPGNKAAAKK